MGKENPVPVPIPVKSLNFLRKKYLEKEMQFHWQLLRKSINNKTCKSALTKVVYTQTFNERRMFMIPLNCHLSCCHTVSTKKNQLIEVICLGIWLHWSHCSVFYFFNGTGSE